MTGHLKKITQENIRTWISVYIAVINTLMILHLLGGFF